MLFHVSFLEERPGLSYHPSNQSFLPAKKHHQQVESIFKPASISGRGRRHVSRSRIESQFSAVVNIDEGRTYRVLDLAGLVTDGILCS